MIFKAKKGGALQMGRIFTVISKEKKGRSFTVIPKSKSGRSVKEGDASKKQKKNKGCCAHAAFITALCADEEKKRGIIML